MIKKVFINPDPGPDAGFNFLSGAWFAGAGCIPVIFILWLLNGFDNTFLLLFFGALPISIAGVCGSSSGASILDPYQVKTSGQAVVRGIKVAVWSYVFFVILSVLGLAVYFTIFSNAPAQTAGFADILAAGAYVAFVGLILAGWLMILAGAIAGLLLFMSRGQIMSDNDEA